MNIQVGDIVQSKDNGRSSQGDGKVTEVCGPSCRVRWNISHYHNWWGAPDLEVLARGEEKITTSTWGERQNLSKPEPPCTCQFVGWGHAPSCPWKRWKDKS